MLKIVDIISRIIVECQNELNLMVAYPNLSSRSNFFLLLVTFFLAVFAWEISKQIY